MGFEDIIFPVARGAPLDSWSTPTPIVTTASALS